MPQFRSAPTVCVLAAALLAAIASTAWSMGDDPAKVPPAAGAGAGATGSGAARPGTTGPGATAGPENPPDLQAKLLYNDGIDELRRADNSDVSAAALADPAQKAHELGEARTLYSTALGKFQRAVRLDSRMYQAWNYVGYTQRKLGDYDAALEAYEQALALRPGYPEALEYRAEAYLAVKRVADAQQSYLDLFAANRAIAGKLLDAMKSWIAAQRAVAPASDLTAVDNLDQWVQERARIAAQTASLTRAGTAASWH